MSQHKELMSPELRRSLEEHCLTTDKPSQLSDSFRNGWKAAMAMIERDAIRYRLLRNQDFEDLYGSTAPYVVSGQSMDFLSGEELDQWVDDHEEEMSMK